MPTELATLGIEIKADDIRAAVAELDRLEKQSGKTEKATDKLKKSWFGFKSVLATLGVGIAIKELITMNNTYTEMENKLRLVTDGHQNLIDTQKALFSISQDTRAGLEGTTDLYSRLARSTDNLNISQQELFKITETVNQTIAISGASAQSANAALFQLGQGLGAGALRGEELNSVLEQTPRLARAIADGLGVSITQLRAMGAEGELTAERVINALSSQSSTVGSEFLQTQKTVSQALQQIENVALQTFGSLDSSEIVESLDDLRVTISDPAIVQGLQDIGAGLLKVVDLAIKTTSALGTMYSSVAEQTTTTAEWLAAYQAGHISFFEWMTTGNETAKQRLKEIQNEIAGVQDAIQGSDTAKGALKTGDDNPIIQAFGLTEAQIDEAIVRDTAVYQLMLDNEKIKLKEQNDLLREQELQELESQERKRMNLLAYYADEEKFERERREQKAKDDADELKAQIARGESAFATMLGNVASHNKTFFGIQKVYRLSKLAMEAPAAIADAYAWGNSWGGPPAGNTMATIAGAAMATYAVQLGGANYGGGAGAASAASAGGAGGNPVTAPITPGNTTLFPEPTENQGGTSFTLIFNGTVIGQEDYVRDVMMPTLEDAITNYDFVFIQQGSKQHQELQR